MTIEIVEESYEQIKKDILLNIASYSEPIDSYYEDHIIDSRHYVMLMESERCGYFSVFQNEMLTQFSLYEKFWVKAQEIFREILAKSQVKEIYLSTSDKLLLLMALDEQKGTIAQDMVFQEGIEIKRSARFFIRKAEKKDIPQIKNTDGGFFKNLEKNIENEELFIGVDDKKVVSYGIIEKSRMFDDLASIGMFVLKEERGKGYGAFTIDNLIRECKSLAIKPIAGCFSANQYSVNALKKAGMVSRSHLLKVKICD